MLCRCIAREIMSLKKGELVTFRKGFYERDFIKVNSGSPLVYSSEAKEPGG
jgi:hypothetical protein